MLSGGQKQAISIARALLRNTFSILLDQASSALHGKVEADVQRSLQAAARNRTAIMVVCRMRTDRDADLICVME
jgi:ABC-type multidrug transport system fused ATPase/permease subunit